MKGGIQVMEEINFKFSQPIPNDYSMLQIRTVGNEIIEVGVIKVRNNQCVTKYISLVQTEDKDNKQTEHYKFFAYHELRNAENIDKVLPRIMNIIDTDTIIYMNKGTGLGILKSKCESMGLQFNNDIINGKMLGAEIPPELREFICSIFDLSTLF